MLLVHCLVAIFLIDFIKMDVNGDATLELKMLVYENSASRDWGGSCCDPFCSACDHQFLFSIDQANGRTDGLDGAKIGSIYQKWSGYFQNQNKNVFTMDIAGVKNPIIQNFVEWPGKVLFKVYVKDDDSTSKDDDIDAFIQPLELNPQGTQATAEWTSLVMYGLRNKDKSSFDMQYRLYCANNYYSKKCTVFCQAQDSDTSGHYTCDPYTGDKVCLPGWKGKNCLTKINECESNQCRNGATCISQIGSYKCSCPVGFTGTNCEVSTNVQCRPGFVGASCDVNICDYISCKNGGNCTAGTCKCGTGYSGSYCELQDQVTCMNRPCENDGTCYDATYRCECLPDYTGTRCQVMKPPVLTGGNATYDRSHADRESTDFSISEIFGSKAGGLLIALIIIIAALLLILLLLVLCLCRYRRKAANAEKDCKMLAEGSSTIITGSPERKISHNTYMYQSSVFSDVSEADSSGRNTSTSELVPSPYADLKPDPFYDFLRADGEKVPEHEEKQRAPPPPTRPKVQQITDVRGESMKSDRKSSC